MKQDQPDCEMRKTCKHIETARQIAREEQRVAQYTIELLACVCVIGIMVLVW